jgi:hypothetical protein
MKQRLTQVFVLSASLMLLSVVLPVNSSSAAVRRDGVPLPPPGHLRDGVPLPPPGHIWASPASSQLVDGVPLPPPGH